MRRNVIIVVAAVLLIAAAIVTNASKKDPSPAGTAAGNAQNGTEQVLEAAPVEGFLAPEFSLTTLDDQTYSFDRGAQDKPALINFWASWCPPCIDEAPALRELHEEYGEKVEFITVNLTYFETRGMDEVNKFVQTYEWSMPILLDEDGEVFQRYRGQGIPLTVLVDGNGVIDHIVYGEIDPKDLEKRLAKL